MMQIQSLLPRVLAARGPGLRWWRQRDNRLRLFLVPFLFMTVFGAIEFGEPLEDVLRGARYLVRQHPAPKSIVVVGVDERTGDALGGFDYSRKIDAQVIDRLFAAGARRVLFDKTYAYPSDREGDAAFVAALERHDKRVVLGAASPIDLTTLKAKTLLPTRAFRERAVVASLNGRQTAFALSAKLTRGDLIGGTVRPSLSAVLANRYELGTGMYRPDWSIDFRTVPTLSFVDVARGRFDPSVVRGNDVVIGPAAVSLRDTRQLVFQGFMPGVYLHVVGAHTLVAGTPADLGWLLPFGIAVVLCLLILYPKRRLRGVSLFSAVILGFFFLPLILDRFLVTIDVVPGIFLVAIVAWRARVLAIQQNAERTNVHSGLPNLTALEAAGVQRSKTLIALKVRNLAQIAASFDGNVEGELVAELCRRLSIDPEIEQIYHGENGFCWLTSQPMERALAEHLEGLHRLVTQAIALRNRYVDLSVAFGVDGDHDRHIASRIGSALLCADEAGRGNDVWKFYDPERQHEAAWQLALMSRLDRALETGEIHVAFQPKLALSSMAIVGVEALVRWQHPTRGAISPEEFIPAAEEHQRIGKLTLFVLGRALALAVDARTAGSRLAVAVNISPRLIGDPIFANAARQALERHRLPKASLILEVTESGDLATAIDRDFMRRAYQDHGILVSLDDFGSKQATFERLHALHPDEVKIDRQFIENVDRDPEKREIVAAVVRMTHALGGVVVAEGVEREQELEYLRSSGCDVVQGFLTGKPMDADLLLALLRQDKVLKAG